MNLVGIARSNAFHIRDIEAFRKAMDAVRIKIVEWNDGAVVIQPWDDDDAGWPTVNFDDEDSPIDVAAAIAEHVVPGDVVVLVEIQSEGMRYLGGHATAFDFRYGSVRSGTHSQPRARGCDRLMPDTGIRRHGDKPMGKRVVAIYLADRAYGGPEEGGWWYDCGERHSDFAPIVCNDRIEVRKALASCRAFIEKRGMNEGRHEPNSVLCDGWYVALSFDGDIAPRFFPESRPRYE